MTTAGSTANTKFPLPRSAERLRCPITPPGTVSRVLPLFSPPGCHYYDAYANCFQHRPEVRAQLSEAARRHEAHRLAAHHNEDSIHEQSMACSSSRDASHAAAASSVKADDVLAPFGLSNRIVTPCRCGLKATQLFATRHDVPEPVLPLSRCELHEVLLSLPPRWQNYPWKLCFDTARDGVSLSTLYRCMEAVEEQQTRAKTVAFGLFFVHTREDAFPSSANVVADASPTASLTGPSSPTSMTSIGTPASSGNTKSFASVQHASSLRYGAARGTLPFSVIGCFTPEVPSLAHRAANIYYGSTDTLVFRLDQLGPSTQRGEWMRRAFEEEEAAAAMAAREKGEKFTTASAAMSVVATRGQPGKIGGGPLSDTKALPASHSSGQTSLLSYARLVDANDQTRAPVPMHTHTTIEHPLSTTAATAGHNASPTVPPSSSIDTGAATDARKVSSLLPAALSTPSPTSGNLPSFPRTSAVRRALRAGPVKGVVPRAPLLARYGWSGRLDNRKFIVCNPHFFALGAGKSGAALYVDEALQFGTSSNWCETYNAPCLFGPREAHSPFSSPTSSPSKTQTLASHVAPAATTPSTSRHVQPSEITSGQHAQAFTSFLPSTLPHREFAIGRVVWFSITEERQTFRLMNAPGDAAKGETMRCSCGRVGGAVDQEAMKGVGLNTLEGSSYLHQCDLLPSAEQPY